MADDIDAQKWRARLEELRDVLTARDEGSAQWRQPVELDQQSVGRLSRMDAMQQQAMADAEARRRKSDIARIDAALKRLGGGRVWLVPRLRRGDRRETVGDRSDGNAMRGVRVVRMVTGTALLLALAACGDSSAPPRDLGPFITVAGHFGEGDEASEDVSGLACDWQAARGGEMRCLVIEDEEAEAQWAVFGNAMLRAGRRFALLGPERPLGAPPSGICAGGISGDGELDGEAAAFSDGAYYVTGSHGCSRNNDEFDAASFLVVRIAPDDQPGTDVAPGTAAVEQSYRLSGLLRRAPELADYFGARLEGGDGLNIEGLAVDGDRMVFGLRAPAVNGTAFLFETSATALFSREIAGTGRAIPVSLEPDEGIRDLAFLPDGRLLILTGPAQNQDVAYRILLRAEDGGLTPLATVSPPYEGKAEAIAVIGMAGNRLSLLVLFDGVNDGAPQRLTLDLP